jgi:UDP-glucose 4-epimerase
MLRSIPASEDDPLAPITAYGAGKATAELYLKLYRAIHGLDCRIARIANPYGAGQDLSRGQGAVTTFSHQALTGQRIVIWGDGEAVRDYVHISDVASCLVTLAL